MREAEEVGYLAGQRDNYGYNDESFLDNLNGDINTNLAKKLNYEMNKEIMFYKNKIDKLNALKSNKKISHKEYSKRYSLYKNEFKNDIKKVFNKYNKDGMFVDSLIYSGGGLIKFTILGINDMLSRMGLSSLYLSHRDYDDIDIKSSGATTRGELAKYRKKINSRTNFKEYY